MKGLRDRVAGMFRGAGKSTAPSSPAPVESSSAQAIRSAIGFHQAGRLQEADAIYRRVLGQEPNNFDALHLTGVIAQQMGESARAIELIRHALAVNPSSHAAHSNLALAYQTLNRLDDAEESVRNALALKPDWDAAQNNLGVILHARGDFDQAEVSFRQALASNPASADALANLGGICKDRGDLDQAEELYRRALALKPDAAEMCNNLGMVLQQRGKLNDAATFYRRALAIKPEYADAHINLGSIFQTQGRLDQAEASFHDALDARSDLAAAYCNLGDVVRALGRLEEAEAFCRKALVLKPNCADVFNNLGLISKARSDPDEAEAWFRKALACDPGHVRSHTNLGTIFNQRGELDEAEACFRTALRLDPASVAARYNLSINALIRGDLEEGFALYESRFESFTRDFAGARGLYENLSADARWHGEALSGRSLLVWTEQGLGDSLMMMRYLPLLKDRGADALTIVCDPTLERIMQSIPGVDKVLCRINTLDTARYDFHCPIMSLPHLFGTRQDSIPSRVPYLAVPETLRRRWSERLFRSVGTKVGLAWAGSNSLRDDARRSIALEQFAPIFDVGGVQLISLQKGEAAKQLQRLGRGIPDWMDACDDFMDTAALIDNLDLVISVDTAVAHLAGALGKPVWLLNRFESEWRWGLEREDTPWYPTMRIIRQEQRSEWGDTIKRIAIELARMVSR